MKLTKILAILFHLLIPTVYLCSQSSNMIDSSQTLNTLAIDFFYKGDYEKSEEIFLRSLNIRKQVFPPKHSKIGDIYSNLGVLNMNKLQFDIALHYFDTANSIYIEDSSNTIAIANIQSNIGNIYRYEGEYLHAIEYYNKSLILLRKEYSPLALERKAGLYNRFALLEIERREYNSAIVYSTKGINDYINASDRNDIILHNLLTTCATAYGMKQVNDSSLYYIRRSIKLFKNNENFSQQYKSESFLKLAEYHIKLDNYDLASDNLSIVEHIYSNSNIDSVFYFEIVKLKAKYYEETNNFDSALAHYNKADKLLLNRNKNLNNVIYASKIKAISLLKDKSNLLLKWYKTDNQLYHLTEMLSVLETISKLIDKARKEYLTIESKLFLAESEGAIFDMGLYCAYELFKSTKEGKYLEKAFYFTEKGKSSVLLESLNEDKAKSFGGIPDSLIIKEQNLKRNLAFYNERIYQENLKPAPDSAKLKTWRDYLFRYSQENESLKELLENKYPTYFEFKYKDNTLTIEDIQKTINRNTTIIEYTLSDSILYTFVINKNQVSLYKADFDSTFIRSLNSFITQFRNFDFTIQGKNIFQKYELEAFDIYNNLLGYIEPKQIKRNLVIIPDGALSYVPFEALVSSRRDKGLTSFNQLNYLLDGYFITYSYSASLYKQTLNRNNRSFWNKLIAIAPDYNYNLENNKQEMSAEAYTLRDILRPLPYAKDEARIISELTNGDTLIGKDATEKYFNETAHNYDILHLAMHTLLDDNNPLYSKLVFHSNDYSGSEGLLTTSDIFALKLKSKMTVLSACSSGEGEFKKGEGVMSLSRGFFYAGCPSLVMTLWKVEDESGKQLMKQYYSYLIKGFSKPKALQRAKIDYIKNTPEYNKHPFFWSSYIIIGNKSAIYYPKWILVVLTVICAGILLFIIKKAKRNKNLPKPALRST